MKKKDRNLLVLFNKKSISKQEADRLQSILHFTESPEQFCIVTELVDRNRITANRKKILTESARIRLRAFRFLINKN
jgi:hypothetical protein